MKKAIFGLTATVFMLINFTYAQEKPIIEELTNYFKENKFGYYEKEQFVVKDLGQTHKMMMSYFEIDNLEEPKIIKSTHRNDVIYYLASVSRDGKTSVAMQLNYESRLLYLSDNKPKASIKCESISCSQNWGCTAEQMGTTLSCSTCTGDCKKTTEIKQSLSLHF
jgi:hypothetical protein